MARKAFFSFHYKADNWRASQVRNMGVIEGNCAISDNAWETIAKGGDAKIKEWIAGQLIGRSCTVVLVGENTAGRKWIKHEIKESWELGKALVGIRIHRLKDREGNHASIGRNPFEDFTVDKVKLSSIVKLYNAPYTASADVYNYIKAHIEDWVEEGIEIRSGY